MESDREHQVPLHQGNLPLGREKKRGPLPRVRDGWLHRVPDVRQRVPRGEFAAGKAANRRQVAEKSANGLVRRRAADLHEMRVFWQGEGLSKDDGPWHADRAGVVSAVHGSVLSEAQRQGAWQAESNLRDRTGVEEVTIYKIFLDRRLVATAETLDKATEVAEFLAGICAGICYGEFRIVERTIEIRKDEQE